MPICLSSDNHLMTHRPVLTAGVCCIRIEANDTVAQQGSYSTWMTPNTYVPVSHLACITAASTALRPCGLTHPHAFCKETLR